MVILGVADGPDAGAALMVDDRLVAAEEQERFDQVPRSRAFPWEAIAAVLAQAGLRERDVDMIGVAGRFTPPFVMRRYPGLVRVAGRSFSAGMDLQLYFQAGLRQTGFGAFEADRASEWLEERFRARSFAPQRTILVDIHKALAESAYRCQPDDDVTVVTLHPMGDGAVCAVHRGRAGQLDKVWEQRGFNALHLHLARCSESLGFRPVIDDDQLWALAARGKADPVLSIRFSRQICAVGPRLECPERGRRALAETYRMLGAAPPADAAATVLHHLCETVRALVAHHARAVGSRSLALGGAVFENPRLVAAVADLPGVSRLWVHPVPGYAALPTGAAVTLGGSTPRLPELPGLGRRYDEETSALALAAAKVSTTALGADGPERLAAVLARGGALARFSGRAGFGRWGLGNRSVLVRADDAAALGRARRALGRSEHEEVGCAALALPEALVGRENLAGPLRYGNVALPAPAALASSVGAALTPDAKIHWQSVEASGDPELHAILSALHAKTGCAAVACFPLARGGHPSVSVPADAVNLWASSGLDALQVGQRLALAGGAS